MRNLFKKSLACCLALALCLTAMVGLTVSAAEVAGTITVGEVTVEPGTAEAKVDITLSAAGLSEAILNVSTDAGTITAVTSDDVSATLATNGIKMALYTEGDSSVDSATATITVALADTQTEKEYTVNVSIATAASVDENLINAEPASGKISVKAAVVECTHENAASVVTTQPTKDAVGVMTYTCECGETWTEDIAIPAKLSANVIAYDLVVQEAVSPRIRINVNANANGIYKLGYNEDYIVSVYYPYYATGYVLKYDTKTYTTDMRNTTLSNTNIHTYDFNELSLLQLAAEFEVTVYAKNADGVVTAYYDGSTSIRAQALSQLAKYSTDTALVKAYADMINYGAAAQKFFASTNAGTDIATAELPTVGFEAYLDKASTADELPAEYNTTNINNLTTVKGAGDLVIGQSNSIAFRILIPSTMDLNTLSANISYKNGYGTLVEDPIASVADVPYLSTSGSNVIHRYLFTKLALYDLNKTVNLQVYDADGNTIGNYEYCIEKWISANINSASYNELLTSMVLFSRSIGAKLGTN